MKPPTTPFWAWNDIGAGWRWYLCIIRRNDIGDEPPTMAYVEEEFDDYWYDDDWSKDDIRVINPPKPKDKS